MRVASTRFVLNPRLLAADPGVRDRLIRHELVHVALGSRDDRIPVWLSEGLAEYLSVRTMPAGRAGDLGRGARRGPRRPRRAARRDTFNDGPSLAANYGVAWWICEAIAETYGE